MVCRRARCSRLTNLLLLHVVTVRRGSVPQQTDSVKLTTPSRCSTHVCFTPFCCNVLYRCTPLLNLRSLIFGVTPFGRLRYITLSPYALFFYLRSLFQGARGGAVGWGTALQAGRSRVRFPMVSMEFFIDITLSVALWPCGRLSL